MTLDRYTQVFLKATPYKQLKFKSLKRYATAEIQLSPAKQPSLNLSGVVS